VGVVHPYSKIIKGKQFPIRQLSQFETVLYHNTISSITFHEILHTDLDYEQPDINQSSTISVIRHNLYKHDARMHAHSHVTILTVHVVSSHPMTAHLGMRSDCNISLLG